MANITYQIDGQDQTAEEFRAAPDRVEAENHLVNAYLGFIGDLVCDTHATKAGFLLNYVSETGECKIQTSACCPEFDVLLNNTLLQKIAESDPDS